ncbi:hypothetical protein HX819_28070 [Pseudomonas sp. D6002]|uniref:hypothetical protein n=1 Tax=unclassified Pseudomonas TaxID=196821 RepID=UPI0015A2A8C3|nr:MULTISPECIES: hypothetical protein [unclassified Pseudomonas]NVZ95174.1 hypothetical protein [Pseudomonas sp. B6001]NWB18307.1 hypothetical protein [Pseudomonas sp. D6002]NWB59109.1 hypothetical protein [Pseudomonas sp. F1002]NWC02772.1 hypothetical protein [Pseudomonas sp. G1002]
MLKGISEFLTKNPIVIVVMFIFTFLSTVAGLMVSWNDLYRDYLSKTVTIPIWLALFFVLSIFFGWIIYSSRARSNREKPIELISGMKFGVERVFASGKRFVSCSFDGSEVVIDGERSFQMDTCEFNASRFTFSGSAQNTLEVLTVFYQSDAFRPIVESTLENIKSGRHPISTYSKKIG